MGSLEENKEAILEIMGLTDKFFSTTQKQDSFPLQNSVGLVSLFL